MLFVANDCVVLQVFCNYSRHNLRHDFPRHLSEIDGLVVTKVFPLALLENLDSICKLSFNQEFSGFPRLFSNHWEMSHNDISHPRE